MFPKLTSYIFFKTKLQNPLVGLIKLLKVLAPTVKSFKIHGQLEERCHVHFRTPQISLPEQLFSSVPGVPVQTGSSLGHMFGSQGSANREKRRNYHKKSEYHL